MADNESPKNILETASEEMENMYLNFSLGDEVYGFEVRHVLQIIGMQEITEMPEMLPSMKGFINMRGNMIPVISMRLRLGKMEETYTDRTCIIVVQINGKEVGLIVDAIHEAITIEPDNISPSPNISERADNSYVIGIARLADNNVSILVDVLKLFDGQL